MKEARAGPVNRCFGDSCPEREREEAVRAALKEAAERTARKRAEALINDLLRLSKGSLIKLLPVIVRRVALKEYPRLVLEVLIERIRRKWDKLEPEDRCLVLQTEASLKEKLVN